MKYTMLPIQEDLVEDAMALLVRWMRADQLIPWDAAGIDDLYQALDDNGRHFLTELARATLKGELTPQDELARRVGISERLLLGLVGEVSTLASQRQHPLPVIHYQAEVIGADGHPTERPTVLMEHEVAELIATALGLPTGSPPAP
jgi:hypothetical protein